MNTDLFYLKVHVDSLGEVWYMLGDGHPVATKLPVTGFMLHPVTFELPKIRIVGMRQNIHLLLALFKRTEQNTQGIVEVCGPLVCKTVSERADPRRVLYAMRTHERAISTGGWHPLTNDDFTSYALTSHMIKMENKVDNLAKQLYQKHPVYIPLKFISHLNDEACIKLLADIVDPRWYVDSMNPGRGSQLRQWLGLDMKTMAGACYVGPQHRYHDRCKLVLSAWTGPHDPKMIERPDYFIWRIYRAAIERKENAVFANLRASQAFIDYLRLCWLAALGRSRHQLEALFVPEYFFKETYEATAFKRYFTDVLTGVKRLEI